LIERRGLRLQAEADGGGAFAIHLAAPAPGPAASWKSGQGYRLTVDAEGIHIAAAARTGFLYAAHTLAQLVGPDGRIPGVDIHDWPAIRRRMVMVAVSQGGFQVIDMAYWKRMIRELAAVKINAIMPYFEGGTFYYEKYPFLGRKGRNGFTVEKARILSEYAHAHGIELAPQQESLGHSAAILSCPELRGLRERGGTFCSSNPEVFRFLGNLYDELVHAFPYAQAIHVGGDEFTHDFALCPLCRARAAEIGKDGLYAEHLMKLHGLLAERRRGMMIWRHEGGFTESAADRLAKDITVFDWHYGNQRTYPTLERLRKLGFVNTWAVPAITRYYNTRGNDWRTTFGNVRGFLRAGVERKIPGECTCTWVHGLWGGRNLFELNYYGLLYSADCAWNPLAASPEDFQRKFPKHWFGITGGRTGTETITAIHEPYGNPAEQKFWNNNRALEPILGRSPETTFAMLRKTPDLPAQAKNLLAFCTRADKQLDAWRTRALRNRVTIDFLKHDTTIHRAAAMRILVFAELYRWCTSGAGPPPKPVLRGLERLLAQYDDLERMFQRSILEAGGGAPGWGSLVTGIIRFRVREGRDGVQRLLQRLKALRRPPNTPDALFH